MNIRWLSAFIWLAALSASPCCSARPFPASYDAPIHAAAARWWPGMPWRLWKAQLWQESRLNPVAVSPMGAMGLAQFMPATWAEVSRAIGMPGVSRQLAGPAIEGGAYYMAVLRGQWRMADGEQRHRFAVASYNAGAGNIRRAARACSAFTEWTRAAACLPGVTGMHSIETRNYVDRIWIWWREMELGA